MKSLNRAMGKTIRFLHIYQNMVIGALVIVLSIVMLIFSFNGRIYPITSTKL